MANQYGDTDTGQPEQDWFASNQPTEAEIAIANAYQQSLGRPASPEEIAAHVGNPGGVQAALTLIQQSPEAQAYTASQTVAGDTGGGNQTGEPPEGWQAWFQALTGGKAPTPAMLKALEPELAKRGVSLAPNAAGVNGKIKLPNGSIIDVIQGASSGGQAWQWLTPEQAGGGNQYSEPSFSGFQGGDPAGFGVPPDPYVSSGYTGNQFSVLERPSAIAQPYVPETWQGGEFVGPEKPASLQSEYVPGTYTPGTFTPPTMADAEADPGYALGMKEGQRGIERSAAARGTVLNPGTVKALSRFSGDYGENRYGNVFNRNLTTFGTNEAGRFGAFNANEAGRMGARQQNAGEYAGDFSRAFEGYRQRYGQFMDSANLSLGARQVNEGAYQNDAAAQERVQGNQYSRYLNDESRKLSDYVLNAGTKRNAETDLWNRNNDVANRGLTAAGYLR